MMTRRSGPRASSTRRRSCDTSRTNTLQCRIPTLFQGSSLYESIPGAWTSSVFTRTHARRRVALTWRETQQEVRLIEERERLQSCALGCGNGRW